MNKFEKADDLEYITIEVKIPKNSICAIINTIYNQNGCYGMYQGQLDTKDLIKLEKDKDTKE